MRSTILAHLALIGALPFLAAGCGQAPETPAPPAAQTFTNTLAIRPDGRLLWNEQPISMEGLPRLLEETKRLPTEPELQFRPAAASPYEVSAQALKIIRQSGVTKFGFVGNEKYRVKASDTAQR